MVYHVKDHWLKDGLWISHIISYLILNIEARVLFDPIETIIIHLAGNYNFLIIIRPPLTHTHSWNIIRIWLICEVGHLLLCSNVLRVKLKRDLLHLKITNNKNFTLFNSIFNLIQIFRPICSTDLFQRVARFSINIPKAYWKLGI